MKEIETLVDICQNIAQHIPLWTQGAGGNVSVKTNDGKMFIKASGYRLDEVTFEKGIVELNSKVLSEKLAVLPENVDAENYYAEALKQVSFSTTERPSMEAGFHAVLPRHIVMHFHALPALLMAHCFEHKETEFIAWLNKSTSLHCTFLPAIRPGWLLSQSMVSKKQTDVFILKNHGVVLQADNVELLNQWKELEINFLKEWYEGKLINFYDENIFENKPIPFKLYFPDSAVFLDRLLNVLAKNEEQLFYLKPDAKTQDRDAFELAWATQILYDVAPQMAEIPEDIASSIATLPVELWRRKIK